MSTFRQTFRATLTALAVGPVICGVAAASASGGSYSGTTSQPSRPAGTVKFTVTANKKTVQKFAGDVFANCTKGSSTAQAHITLLPTNAMSIKRQAFGFNGNFNIDSGKLVIAKKVRGVIKGKFSGSTATGTMSFKWKFDSTAPASYRGYACQTGTATWTAKHK